VTDERPREGGVMGGILIAVGGVLASGKSTTSRAIAEAIGAQRIEADELRAAHERNGEDEALVPGFSDVVYDELFRKAEAALRSGRPVVLDGTFRSRERRLRARDLAARHDATFRFVECYADDALIRSRLRERPDPDGWIAMYEHFLTLWEPVDELGDGELLRFETSGKAAAPDAAQLRIETP
jgi:predicted kinase